MRVLICGSRGWKDARMIRDLLVELAERATSANDSLLVIHGAAPGADALVDEEARRLGIRVLKEPAQWKTYGRAAGPIRNQVMLGHQPDEIYAFRSTGKSNGTDDMIARGVRAGVPTWTLDATGNRTQKEHPSDSIRSTP